MPALSSAMPTTTIAMPTLKPTCPSTKSTKPTRKSSVPGIQSANGFIAGSLIERAGVDDGLRLVLRAQHDKQVGHHRGPAFVVEMDDVALRQALERHLHHA